MRSSLRIGTIINFILFVPALYFAFKAMSVASWSGQKNASLIVVLAILLPVLCFCGPILAWRLFDKHLHKTAMAAIVIPIVLALAWAAYVMNSVAASGT